MEGIESARTLTNATYPVAFFLVRVRQLASAAAWQFQLEQQVWPLTGSPEGQ